MTTEQLHTYNTGQNNMLIIDWFVSNLLSFKNKIKEKTAKKLACSIMICIYNWIIIINNNIIIISITIVNVIIIIDIRV